MLVLMGGFALYVVVSSALNQPEFPNLIGFVFTVISLFVAVVFFGAGVNAVLGLRVGTYIDMNGQSLCHFQVRTKHSSPKITDRILLADIRTIWIDTDSETQRVTLEGYKDNALVILQFDSLSLPPKIWTTSVQEVAPHIQIKDV